VPPCSLQTTIQDTKEKTFLRYSYRNTVPLPAAELAQRALRVHAGADASATGCSRSINRNNPKRSLAGYLRTSPVSKSTGKATNVTKLELSDSLCN
jgi:hypothetical protein